MASCQMCGKHTVFGHKVARTRSGYYSHTNRKIQPNLQKATLVIEGKQQKVTACTRCLRAASRANRIRQ